MGGEVDAVLGLLESGNWLYVWVREEFGNFGAWARPFKGFQTLMRANPREYFSLKTLFSLSC